MAPLSTAQGAAVEDDPPTHDGGNDGAFETVMSQAELAEALGCGRLDLGALHAAAAAEAATVPLVEDPRTQLERHRLFGRADEEDPLAVGRWVRVNGLQGAPHLNGRTGLVVEAKNLNERVGVALAGFGNKLVRTTNIVPFGDEETVKVARIYARGERGAGVQTWRWPMNVLLDRPCETSPISERVGIPLNVTRVEPDRPLTHAEQLDSQWVKHLMLDVQSGSTRRPWNRAPGPVVVSRADLQPFSADDLCCVVCFIDSLLHRYADKVIPIDVDSEITPEAFHRFLAQELAVDESFERTKWWDDINL